MYNVVSMIQEVEVQLKNSSFSECYHEFFDSTNILLTAAGFIDEGLPDGVLVACANNTCGKALNDTLSFIDFNTIPKCNLIELLYNESPYEEFQLKGYRDFYMKMAGYI